MKKLFFTALFVIITSYLYGQTAPENRWLLGKWTGEYKGFGTGVHRGSMVNYTIEIGFNDNGTGTCNDSGYGIYENERWNVLRSGDIIFSINGNKLAVFTGDGTRLIIESILYRINDRRLVLRYKDNNFVCLNKSN